MTTTSVQSPFKPFICVSFYDNRKIKRAPESESYRLKELKAEELPWEWYVYRSALKGFDDPPTLVRAFRLTFPMRILAAPRGEGTATMELPEGAWLVHNGSVLSRSDHEAFELSFVSVTDMVAMVEDRGLWGELATWVRLPNE